MTGLSWVLLFLLASGVVASGQCLVYKFLWPLAKIEMRTAGVVAGG